MRMKIASALSVVAVLAGVVAAPSAHAEGGVSIMACGYYETQTDAYYGHCTSKPAPGNGARIRVDYDWTPFDGYMCVRPGENRIGSTSEIDNAWYIESCWNG